MVFPSHFPTKFLTHFSYLLCMSHIPLTSLSLPSPLHYKGTNHTGLIPAAPFKQDSRLVLKCNLHGVCKCLDKPQGRVPTSKWKKVHINICPQTVFEVQPPRSPDLNPFHFYLWGHLKTPVYSSPIENEETIHQGIFVPVKTFATTPGLLKGSDSP